MKSRNVNIALENKCASGSHNLLIHLSRSLDFHSRRVFRSAPKTFSLNERQFGRRDAHNLALAHRKRSHAPPVTRNSLAKCKIKVSNELKVIVHVNISRTHFVQGVRARARQQQVRVWHTRHDEAQRRGRGGLLSYVLVCSLLLQMATSMEDLIKSGSWFIVVRARGVGCCLAHMLRAMQAGERRERASCEGV